MAIYGTPLTFGGGGGSNDTLPPLLNNFSAAIDESQTGQVILSADKMQESRATDLAGAVWVYGDHLPKNVNDGTKIELDRNDVVSSELGLPLTLKELPPSDANHKVIVNLPETDGKLHPYLYLTNDYNGSGKGCLLKYIVNEAINSTGTKYEDGRFDIACQNFKNRLAPSVRGYITPVTVFSWNSSTGGKNITREIFLLSQRESGGGSDVYIKQFPFFNIQSNRIAKDEGGSARGWWCREFNNTNPSYVNYQGVISSTSGSQYFRPAVAMSLDLPLNPIPKEDGSYDFLETAKSKVKTVKATKQTVGNLPSKSKVKLGRYGGNELSWITTKDAEGRQYLRLDSGSVSLTPFKTMIYDNKEPSNTDTNIRNNGNNMFALSNLFQWLNSDKTANNWYTPQHAYDAPPPYANQDGFLKDWTEQEKQILLNKVWETSVPKTVSSSLQKFTAKVVVPSMTEVGISSNMGGSKLDIYANNSDRVVNGSPYWTRSSDPNNTYMARGVDYQGSGFSSNCIRADMQVVPLVSIPINTPVELGSDGAYRLLLDVMLPTVKVTVTYPKNKNFYARQFTYNPKKQYQTMLEGAIASLKLVGVPKPVTDLQATHSGSVINLTWKNPVSDENYDHTVVVYKTDAFPETIEGGTQGYSGTDESASISELELGKTYYIAVFTVSSSGVYGQPETIQIDIPAGQLISSLPSNSKVKLGKFNGQDLKWLVCRDSADQSLRLILEASSVGFVGNKMYDNAEPSNSNTDRRSYGNNRYIWSNIHQWLNSNKAAGAWYSAQHSVDAPPSYTNVAGFLSEWTEKEISVLEIASWVVTKTSVDGGGTESFYRRIVLPSTTEMGLESGTGGSKLDIFNSNGDRVVSGVYYWCRTPHPSYSSRVRGVITDGALDYYGANYSGSGVRPLCKPLSNTLVSSEVDNEGCFTIV